jgi:hypothetical protein
VKTLQKIKNGVPAKRCLILKVLLTTDNGELLVTINGKAYRYWLDAALIPRIEALIYVGNHRQALKIIKEKARLYEKVN